VTWQRHVHRALPVRPEAARAAARNTHARVSERLFACVRRSPSSSAAKALSETPTVIRA
jgi:hypothetical protein